MTYDASLAPYGGDGSMNTTSTMLYTVGTALDRAQQDGHSVDLLVEGQWLGGLVVARDGQGVVLESAEHDHSIVRLEVISAVRVRSSFPLVRRIATAGDERGFPTGETLDGVIPMPGPRLASD